MGTLRYCSCICVMEVVKPDDDIMNILFSMNNLTIENDLLCLCFLLYIEDLDFNKFNNDNVVKTLVYFINTQLLAIILISSYEEFILDPVFIFIRQTKISLCCSNLVCRILIWQFLVCIFCEILYNKTSVNFAA